MSLDRKRGQDKLSHRGRHPEINKGRAQYAPSTVRVVLDIEHLTDCKFFLLEIPARLVIDVYGKHTDTIKEKSEFMAVKRRVVIDAGHGGHDPGAVGLRKLYEKDVVLDIALKVKKILSEDPLYEVFLTRDKDVFLPLEARTAIANRKNADLFVSVHANARPRREAKGIETYLLNWTLSEFREAARLTGLVRGLVEWLMVEPTSFGVRISPLNNRFLIWIRVEASAEARQLTPEKVSF